MNCLECGQPTTNPCYCSRSCSAKANNVKSPKRKRLPQKYGTCLNCGTHVYKRTSATKYCSIKCSADFRTKSNKIKLEQGKLGIRALRNYLKRQHHMCASCGIGPTWNGKHLTLELDHINGDFEDNRLSNARLLCPNCHSQTDTYKARNIGNTLGPKARGHERIRYKHLP